MKILFNSLPDGQIKKLIFEPMAHTPEEETCSHLGKDLFTIIY